MRFACYCLIACSLLCTLPLAVNAGELKGSMSCASATCHGGVVGRGPAWTHSFNVSRSNDPHVKAGLTLFEPTSQRIVKALSPDVKSVKDPLYHELLRERCISCHLTTTPNEITSVELISPLQIFEGVSCESCHGAASEWFDQHVLVSWTGPERFSEATGMLDTESILGRSEVCMKCHVGSRTADGMVRDMNHDLIAAGHPALRFDLLIYHEAMPHHWDDKGLVERAFNESPFRIRAVSRLAGLSAAARLSGERAQDSLAEQSDAPEAVAGTKASKVPWPELADFDCFACHQSLSPRAYRLPILVDGKPTLNISNGLPLWNAWYSAPLAAAGNTDVWKLRPRPGGQADWVATAKQLADAYREKAVAEAAAPPPAAPFAAVRQQLGRRAPSDWHSAVAMYLELDAAARELRIKPDSQELGIKVEKILNEEVAPRLLFGLDRPQAESRRSSPADFDPREFREATLKALKSVYEEQP